MRFRYVLLPVKAILVLAVIGSIYAWSLHVWPIYPDDPVGGVFVIALAVLAGIAWCGIIISTGRKNIGTILYFIGWMLAGAFAAAVLQASCSPAVRWSGGFDREGDAVYVVVASVLGALFGWAMGCARKASRRDGKNKIP